MKFPVIRCTLSNRNERNAAPSGCAPESALRVMEKLKVIVSAFYCGPHKGSEPGIGWNVARELAQRHRVWVVTDSRHRGEIEKEQERNPVAGLSFIFFSLPRWLPLGKANLYHYVWQLLAFFVFRKAHREIGFDLSHHVTLVRYWSPSLLCLLPMRFIWGPVGGGEMIAAGIRRDLPLRSRLREFAKAAILWLSQWDPLLRLTARRSAMALANTPETARKMQRLGARNVLVMGESALDSEAMAPPRTPRDSPGALRFASMTRLVYWKGVDLGLEAFARLDDRHAEYWIFGEGAEERRLRQLCRRLGIENRVRFAGNPPRKEWLEQLRACDVLVHPCLCNSGGMISLEAMAAGIPVICLAAGGIISQVADETGVRISAGSRAAAVRGIARAMQEISADPALRRRMGAAGRERAERLFTWEKRAEIFHALYSHLHGKEAFCEEPATSSSAVESLKDLSVSLPGRN